MPTEKAHGLQISKMCEAYADNNQRVELIVPRKKNNIKDNIFDYYGIKKNFLITYIPVPTFFPITSVIGYYLAEFVFLLQVLFHLRKRKGKCITITRDIIFVLFFGGMYTSYYEIHDFPEKHLWLWKKAMMKAKGVIVTNTWKKKKITEQFGLSEVRIFVAPNGYDPQLFSPHVKGVEKDDLGIEKSAKVLCYAGMLKTLGVGKGVDFLIEAATTLPNNVVFLLIGGSDQDISEYKNIVKQYKVENKIFFIGRVPHKDLGRYLNVADAYVAPFPDTEHYRHYMSPIKLFEYIAMGKPVIASDLPSIREVLGDFGHYFTPEDRSEFVSIVKDIFFEKKLNNAYTEQLLEYADRYTWNKRAKNVIRFMFSKNTEEG
jgi:glycosyltransferase involved in cell wall biosynthesis